LEDRIRSGTLDGLVGFLDKYAKDPEFNSVTIMAMKSGVNSVVSLLGLDPRQLVSELDIESIMDRFQAAKGPAFRSAATYRTRLRVATQLYHAWLEDDPDWKAIARTRAPAPPETPKPSARTMVIPFPVDGDLTVRLELPYSLNRQTAKRLHGLIESLVIEDDSA
jgi:hypothetical protein